MATLNAEKIDINTLDFDVEKTSFVYNGKEQKLSIIIMDIENDYILEENVDYIVTYYNNINAGTAIATITSISDIYDGTKDISFTITRINIASGILSCGSPDSKGNYNLDNILVSLDNKILNKYEDYTYSIFERTNGKKYEAVVTVSGINNYTGELQEVYTLGYATIDISTIKISLEEDVFIYSGNLIVPEVKTTLIRGTDYDVEYSGDSVNAGSYYIYIKGIGEYSGSVNFVYTIEPKPITDALIIFDDADSDGCKEISSMQVIVDGVDLKYLKDYTYTIKENEIENGYVEGECTIHGINNYTGFAFIKVLTSRKEVYFGKEIVLEKVTIYPRYCLTRSEIVKSGTFYLWDNKVKNGKVRITNNPDRIGQPGFVTGWVNIDDLINKDSIKIGDKVLVNGIINTYADGSGNNISKKNTTMYVVDILDSNQFEFNFGLATAVNRTRQGWANESMIKKVSE